jgi:7-keto-8-aminopelargonate synthetase-like enzyme
LTEVEVEEAHAVQAFDEDGDGLVERRLRLMVRCERSVTMRSGSAGALVWPSAMKAPSQQ